MREDGPLCRRAGPWPNETALKVAGGFSRLRCFQQQLYGFHHQRIKAPVFAGSLSNSLH